MQDDKSVSPNEQHHWAFLFGMLSVNEWQEVWPNLQQSWIDYQWTVYARWFASTASKSFSPTVTNVVTSDWWPDTTCNPLVTLWKLRCQPLLLISGVRFSNDVRNTKTALAWSILSVNRFKKEQRYWGEGRERTGSIFGLTVSVSVSILIQSSYLLRLINSGIWNRSRNDLSLMSCVSHFSKNEFSCSRYRSLWEINFITIWWFLSFRSWSFALYCLRVGRNWINYVHKFVKLVNVIAFLAVSKVWVWRGVAFRVPTCWS